jgi:hypothetical protein
MMRPFASEKDLFKGRDHGAFGRRAAGHGRVCRIRKQRQHAFLSVTSERTQIDRLADHRRLVNLVIAGVNDRADRRFDRE